LRLWKLVERFV